MTNTREGSSRQTGRTRAIGAVTVAAFVLATGDFTAHGEPRAPAATAKKQERSPAASGTRDGGPSAQGVVNINTATAEQLQHLPRVGPGKARAIIHRRNQRRFRHTWDILTVKGIGRKTYRLLRPFLVVEGETTLTQKARTERQDPQRE